MKILLLAHILALFIYGCGLVKTEDEVEGFIPGTYIRFSQHEFGNEYDTLAISVQNKWANEYKILRKWKYERILDGEKIEPEYKRSVTTGIYNSTHKLLRENETGDLLTFDVSRNLLFAGSAQYKKIK